MTIDGGAPMEAWQGILAWNAPLTLAPGTHTITVSATDFGERSVSQTVTVTVLGSCAAGAACPAGFACVAETCWPGADVAGGFGASCTASEECIVGACASDGEISVCTGTCDAGGTCPAGFECTSSNVCWPASESGGCNASGAGGVPFGALAGLAGLLGLIGLRRRRRARAA
jgi:MYXO-CTERM domain-containing protein